MLPLRSDDRSPLPMLDLTAPAPDLWQRIRNGFGMPDLDDKRVINQQAWYLNRPGTLKIIFERSRRYLYHIVTELEKRGMPTELALLPMVESAFNPLAYSPARALGLWQFIPATGRRYDLNQNAWVDDRRDIIASTQAALDYLQTIYEMHGDWHLALASYNWGENAVARAVTKNKAKNLPTDYTSLAMPGETRYYVPKLQAFKNIIAQPDLFGIALEPLPNEPYFGTVHISDDVDIALAARLAEIPLAEFIALNPAYHRPVILGTNSSPLVFPVNNVQTFLENLKRHEDADKPLTSWATYALKPKEKLESVATRFHMTLTKLKQLNGITPRTKIQPGFALLVPGVGASAETLAAALPKAPADPSRRIKSKSRRASIKKKAR